MMEPALKARFNAPVRRQSHADSCRNDSRFQRWRFSRMPGALPQATYERRAFGAKQLLRRAMTMKGAFGAII
jgi:hypothetical protein